jgi:hypothetical protein
MALIPIVLEFSQVAKDTSLSLALTTKGVAWSLGDDDHDSMGFSYNALALGEVRPSCIQSIELTDSFLAMRTIANATSDSFTLSLFVNVSPGIEFIEGYCTLNSEALVLAHVGYGSPAEWRNGPVSTTALPIPEDVRRIRFNIQRPPVGVATKIQLSTEGEQPGIAYWCLGAPECGGASVTVKAADGSPLALRTFSMSDRQIEIMIGSVQAGKPTEDVLVEAYVRRVDVASKRSVDDGMRKLDRINLKAICSAGTTVIAQVGTQRPQYLTNACKCFIF